MLNELRKRPFARLLLCWITGTLLQYYIPYASWGAYLLLLPAIGGMVASLFPAVYTNYNRRGWWGAGFACLILFLSIQDAHYKQRQTMWEFAEDPLVVRAIVLDTPTEKPRSVYCPLRLQAGYQVQAYFAKDSAALHLRPGSEVYLKARFRAVTLPYLRHKGFAASAYIPRTAWRVLPDTRPTPFSLQSLAVSTLCWRDVLVKRYEKLRLSAEERAILSAITLGYTATMGNELRQHFSVSGVSHILSVSGFHVAIVCAFVSLLLSVLPICRGMRLLKYFLILLVIWLFAATTGLSAPAVRAALMLSLYLTGRLLRRQVDGYNTLASAAFLMLVYNPFYLFDIGFQLSYAAVFFILYLQPRFNRLIEIRNPLLAAPRGWITVTLAAQIGTLPLCLYVFGMASVVFLFTNLPLSVLATVLIPFALGWVLLEPLLPANCFLQLIPETLIGWMNWIVYRFGSMPGASFRCAFGFSELFLCYAALFFLLLYGRKRRPRMLLFSLLLVLIMLLIQVAGINKLCGI